MLIDSNSFLKRKSTLTAEWVGPSTQQTPPRVKGSRLSLRNSADVFIQDPKQGDPIKISWDDLLPYIGRHIGMRPRSDRDQENFVFAIGTDFGKLAAGMNPAVDQAVTEALKKNSSVLAGLLINQVRGTIDKQKVDEFDNPLPYTEEQLNDFSSRLWAKASKNPEFIMRLKYMLAEDLKGKISIEGMDLKPTLTAQKEMTWGQVQPYVLGFLGIGFEVERTSKGQVLRMIPKVCKSEPSLTKSMKPEEIDWGLIGTVFFALSRHLAPDEMGNDTIFVRRIIKAFEAALAETKITDESIANLTAEQRDAVVERVQTRFHEHLTKDQAWNWLVMGILADEFETAKYPPLVFEAK